MTFGESLMKQTGWNVSILVGGPMPREGGELKTYMFVFHTDVIKLTNPNQSVRTLEKRKTALIIWIFLGKKNTMNMSLLHLTISFMSPLVRSAEAK
jgi:hypothetical protein